MGDHVWDWFLPLQRMKGDGVRFEFNQTLVKKLQARARAIATGELTGIGAETGQQARQEVGHD
jgi:hypothetical protein